MPRSGEAQNAARGIGPQETVEWFAHRMRSHIQVLMGYAELLQDDIHLDRDEPASAYLNAMRRAVDQIGRSVDNFVADYLDARLPLPDVPETSRLRVSGTGRLAGMQRDAQPQESVMEVVAPISLAPDEGRQDSPGGTPSPDSPSQLSSGQDG